MIAEKHYRAAELANMWGVSRQRIARLFEYEPGVLRLPGRERTVLCIPESVASRVYERLSRDPLQAREPRRNPLRVKVLCRSHAGVPKQLGNVSDSHAAQQSADGERIA